MHSFIHTITRNGDSILTISRTEHDGHDLLDSCCNCCKSKLSHSQKLESGVLDSVRPIKRKVRLKFADIQSISRDIQPSISLMKSAFLIHSSI